MAYGINICNITEKHIKAKCSHLRSDIKSFALVHCSQVPEDFDPSIDLTWTNLAALINMAVLVHGIDAEYDGGAPVMQAGVSGHIDVVVGYDHSFTFRDPNLVECNAAFYNLLDKTDEYRLVWWTGNKLFVSQSNVTFSHTMPMTANGTEIVRFIGLFKWKSNAGEIPVPYDMPPTALNNSCVTAEICP